MISINNTPSVRRMLRNTISTLASCLLLVQLIFVSSAFGQGSALSATAVHSNLCPPGFHCCQLLTFTAGVATDELDIQLPFPSTLDPTCWNWGCANNTLGITPTALFDNSTPQKQNGWHFKFNPSLAAGKTIQIMLCPVDGREDCAYAWTSLNWTSYSGTPPVVIASGTAGILPCQNNSSVLCPSCDQVDIYNPNVCYERLCVTRHWPTSNSTTGRTFILHIVPGLTACNKVASGSNCPYPVITIDQTEYPGASFTEQDGPPGPNGAPTYTNLTLSYTGDLGGCETFCINIPKCNPAVSHTVVVNNPDDPHPCAAVTAAFKTVGGPDPIITAENFPNPLTRANQFKTVIPFEIGQNGGDARVSVINDAGKLVYQDVQTFAGSGKHFFYFTGEQLPSGKYFYTIESPIGAVIVKKSLLIVK